jgi:hypothetical protein
MNRSTMFAITPKPKLKEKSRAFRISPLKPIGGCIQDLFFLDMITPTFCDNLSVDKRSRTCTLF